MQKNLSQNQISAFYHDHFVASQVSDFIELVHPKSGCIVVDIGGGCGFFAENLQHHTGQNVRVLDTDSASVDTCRAKGVDAEVDNALSPRVRGDEEVICFNLILHHLIGPNDAATLVLQRRALEVWHGRARFVFVNEYIYDSYISTFSGRIIYEITSGRLLSGLASLISHVIPSLRANTFGVGVRFRAHDEWVRIFGSLGFKVVGFIKGAEEPVSFARRLLMIRSCRRDSFLIEPIVSSLHR